MKLANAGDAKGWKSIINDLNENIKILVGLKSAVRVATFKW